MAKRIIWKRNPNTEYVFQVRAKNRLGEYSAWSEPAKITTASVPALAAPTKVEAWPIPLMNMIMVFWSSTPVETGRRDIDHYNVYRTTHGVAASVTSDDLIAEVKGRMHFDYSKDYKGVAQSGSTGATLKCSSLLTLRSDMVGEKILNLGTFASAKTSYATITAIDNSTKTITATLSGGDVWAQNDRFIVDYVPLRNQLYYYWISAVSQEGRESPISEADGATLGRPSDATIDSFAEDETEDFAFLKGWRMQFSCSGGAEGYYVRYKRTTASYWSLPIYVRHDGEPDDPQTHVFKNLVVGVNYTFAVRAVNHLIFRDYMQEDWTTATDTVEDSGSPQPPTGLAIAQGPFNNWIRWTPSTSGDVKYYQIYRVQRETGAAEPTENDVDLSNPYVRYWSSHSSMFIDPLAGSLDRKNWWYWIRAVDWFGNASSLEGPEKEEGVPNYIEFEIEPTLLGNKLSWDPPEDAAYYKIYRSRVENDPAPTCIAWHWLATSYIDLLRYNVAQTHYYWVNVVSKSRIESLFRDTGIPSNPELPDIDEATTGELPENRVNLNYDSLAITVKNKLDLISQDELSDEISSISISPQSITLQSGGTISLTSGQSITLASDVGINIGQGGLIKGESIGTWNYLAVLPTGSAILRIGKSDLRWQTNSQYSLNTFFDFTGTFSLRASNLASSQIYMSLPQSHNGSNKEQYQLWVDEDDDFTVKAKKTS